MSWAPPMDQWSRGSSGRGFSGQSEYRGSSGHVIGLRGVSGQCTCFEGGGRKLSGSHERLPTFQEQIKGNVQKF